jgi:DNA-binding CsgD family transcriptional regulator
MDVLRKEINSIYEAQFLHSEHLDPDIIEASLHDVATSVAVSNDCRVITDASADTCWIVGGAFAAALGLQPPSPITNTLQQVAVRKIDSSDEDVIYNRLHPEDLVEKRMLEFEFFRFADTLPADSKLDFKATCRLRMKSPSGEYILIDNSTRLLRLSPAGKIWLILCCYDYAVCRDEPHDISPAIVNMRSGEVMSLHLSDRRLNILTTREKEILNLIRQGKLSKEIASQLGISVNTVNRHRQNILEKLSVGNSMEAVLAATEMKLL